MDQCTHAWIAVRAIALLEDKKANPNLVKLLKPYAHSAAIGAWIPDLADAKRGGGGTQHHVFKYQPLPVKGKANGAKKEKRPEDRFVATKDQLLTRLAGSPQICAFLAQDKELGDEWWSQPYQAKAAPGQHLPNRAMALSTALRDLLLIAEKSLDELIPGRVAFLEMVDGEARTRAPQAVLYLFMLSHFVADACMPCHCDHRGLAGYDKGWHAPWEKHWAGLVGKAFDKKKLLPPGQEPPTAKEVLDLARSADRKGNFKLDFADPISPIPNGRDVWLEAVDMCRASFALAQIAVPEKDWQKAKTAPFKQVFPPARQKTLQKMDQAILHDAVMNTAMVWNHLWEKISK